MPPETTTDTIINHTQQIQELREILEDLINNVLPETAREFHARLDHEHQRMADLETGFQDALNNHRDTDLAAQTQRFDILRQNLADLEDGFKESLQRHHDKNTEARNEHHAHIDRDYIRLSNSLKSIEDTIKQTQELVADSFSKPPAPPPRQPTLPQRRRLPRTPRTPHNHPPTHLRNS